MNELRILMQRISKKDKAKVGNCKCTSSANETDSVASTGTPRPPVDRLNHCTFNSFKDEDYTQDKLVMRLHIAARENNTNTIRKILEKGASVHLPDAVGRSALHWAAVFCKLDTVESIIKIFPVSRLDMGDRNGCTPLHYAVLAGRADAANMLLKAGCHVHSIDNQGRTPLHFAAQNANASVVLLLLKRGADPSYLDKMKRSPYDVAKEYNNTDKILERLRLETSNIPREPEKPKPIEPRHKPPSKKKKAIETDGKVSITFYSVKNMEAERTLKSWQSYVPETEKEEFITDTPVEIVKEEMERDAERMKYKLRKIEMRKDPLSEEKLKEQERALQQLLDRSKKNAMEERRKKLAEEERIKLLTQNRTRSATPKTCSIPRSSLGMRTPTESILGPFQTSHRPSNASSPKCETAELAPGEQDEWREETWTSDKVHKMKTRPQSPAELPTQNDSVEKTTRKAEEHAPQKAGAVLSDHQAAASAHEKRAKPDDEQDRATSPPTHFPPYVHQWFAKTFSYPTVSEVGSSRDKCVPISVFPEPNVGIPSEPPTQKQESQRNFMGSSPPPQVLTNDNHSNAPSDIPSAHEGGERNPLSPPSALSSSSYKSPEPHQWDSCGAQSPPSMSVGTNNCTAPSSPPARKMEEPIRHTAVASAPDDGQKQTKVLSGYRNAHNLIKHKDRRSNARNASKSPKISDGPTSLPCRDGSNRDGKFSHNTAVSAERSKGQGEDPFTLGYAHSFNSRKTPKSLVDALPNRHGLECFSRPKARKSKVRTSADNRYQYKHIPSKQLWSPEEPWRPGGISKTVIDFKMYGLLKSQRKKPTSVQPLRSVYRKMQSKHPDDQNVDSDPLANVEAPDDEYIDRLPLAKIILQQEALWSLRQASQLSSGKPDRQGSPNSKTEHSTQRNLDRNTVSCSVTNAGSPGHMPQSFPAAEFASKTEAQLDMTCRAEEEGQGMLVAQMIEEQSPQSQPDEHFQQRQFDSLSRINPSELTQTMPTHPQSLSQPSQLGLQYGSFIEQERQQAHPNPASSYSNPQTECSPALPSNHSTSEELPQATFLYPPNSSLQLHTTSPCHPCHTTGTIPSPAISTNGVNPKSLASWPQQSSELMLEYETQSYKQDDLENRVPKTSSQEYEIGNNQQRDRVVRSRLQNSGKISSSRCSLERTSSARLALTGYYGQSARHQFLGLRREPAPVHQCVDVESLIKQWL